MRFVTDLSKGILGKSDSFDLWQEIINIIPDEVFLKKDLKILNVACGHGTEADIIVKRMTSLGRTVQEIQDSMYLNDKYSVFTKEAYNKGYKNVIKQDFMEWESNMKFDIVIGNPPYEAATKEGRKDQANNLWSKFTNKSMSLVKDGGYVSLITPTSWLSPAADIGKGKHGTRFFEAYFQRYKTHVLNVNECAKHFNVGSTFSYFVLEKTESNNFNTRVITEEDDFTINLNTISYLPKSMNPLSIGINKKVLEQTEKFGIVGNNLPETRIEMKKEKDSKFNVPCYNTPAKGGTYWYSQQPIDTANKAKVIISISGNYVPIYDQGGKSFTGMCLAYYLKNNDNMDSIRSFLESKLIKFVLSENKYTGWVSPVVSELPNIDKTKLWTDQDLYNYFSLTQEEVNYIESK